MRTKLGIFGCGVWAQKYLEAARRREDVEVIGYARLQDLDHPAFSVADVPRMDVHDLFRESEAILAAAGPEAHRQAMGLGVHFGRPVLLEKPAALRAAEVREMVYRRADLKRAPVLMIDHIHLFADGFRALKAELGRRGVEPCGIRATDVGHGPVRDYPALLDYGPHPLSMILDLLGLDAPILVGGVDAVEDHGGNTVAHLVVGRSSHTRVRLEVGNCAPRRRRSFKVECRDGAVLSFGADHVGQANLGLVLAEFLFRVRQGVFGDRDLLRELRILETLEAIQNYSAW